MTLDLCVPFDYSLIRCVGSRGINASSFDHAQLVRIRICKSWDLLSGDESMPMNSFPPAAAVNVPTSPPANVMVNVLPDKLQMPPPVVGDVLVCVVADAFSTTFVPFLKKSKSMAVLFDDSCGTENVPSELNTSIPASVG